MRWRAPGSSHPPPDSHRPSRSGRLACYRPDRRRARAEARRTHGASVDHSGGARPRRRSSPGRPRRTPASCLLVLVTALAAAPPRGAGARAARRAPALPPLPACPAEPAPAPRGAAGRRRAPAARRRARPSWWATGRRRCWRPRAPACGRRPGWCCRWNARCRRVRRAAGTALSAAADRAADAGRTTHHPPPRAPARPPAVGAPCRPTVTWAMLPPGRPWTGCGVGTARPRTAGDVPAAGIDRAAWWAWGGRPPSGGSGSGAGRGRAAAPCGRRCPAAAAGDRGRGPRHRRRRRRRRHRHRRHHRVAGSGSPWTFFIGVRGSPGAVELVGRGLATASHGRPARCNRHPAVGLRGGGSGPCPACPRAPWSGAGSLGVGACRRAPSWRRHGGLGGRSASAASPICCVASPRLVGDLAGTHRAVAPVSPPKSSASWGRRRAGRRRRA